MLYMLLYLFLFTAITYIFGGIIQGFNSNELDILVKNGTIITEEKYIWVIGYIFDVIVFLFLNLLIVSIASLFINSKNVLFVIIVMIFVQYFHFTDKKEQFTLHVLEIRKWMFLNLSSNHLKYLKISLKLFLSTYLIKQY